MLMRRQRTIRPGTMSDPRVTATPPAVRFFAIALMMWADDHGRGEVLPRRMIRDMLPDDPDVTPERVETMLLMLDDAGFLHLYADEDGRSLFQIAPDLLGTVDRRNASAIPEPEFANTFANSFANRVANRGLGRESERVEFRESEPESVGLPPDPFCERHPGGTKHACRHCGTARLRLERWKRLQDRGMPTDHLEQGESDESGWGETF